MKNSKIIFAWLWIKYTSIKAELPKLKFEELINYFITVLIKYKQNILLTDALLIIDDIKLENMLTYLESTAISNRDNDIKTIINEINSQVIR